jgi:hypothetical protein
LSATRIGTVVYVFETADAYLVEFVNPADGSTRALRGASSPDQIGIELNGRNRRIG